MLILLQNLFLYKIIFSCTIKKGFWKFLSCPKLNKRHAYQNGERVDYVVKISNHIQLLCQQKETSITTLILDLAFKVKISKEKQLTWNFGIPANLLRLYQLCACVRACVCVSLCLCLCLCVCVSVCLCSTVKASFDCKMSERYLSGTDQQSCVVNIYLGASAKFLHLLV